jgi:hypothetical protein
VLHLKLSTVYPIFVSRYVTTLMSTKCDYFFVCGHNGMIGVQVLVS